MYAINLVPHDHAPYTVHVASVPRIGELVTIPRGEYRVFKVRHIQVEEPSGLLLVINVYLTLP